MTADRPGRAKAKSGRVTPPPPGGDIVTHMVEAWARERPDLDVWPFRIYGAVEMLAIHLERALDPIFTKLGVKGGDYELLTNLRRVNPEHRASPTDLAIKLNLTTGAVTRRLDRLEQRGLLRRLPHDSDRRALIIELTPAGLKLADKAVELVLARTREVLMPLRDHVEEFESLVREVTTKTDD